MKIKLEKKETTYNGQGGGKPTIVGQRGLSKLKQIIKMKKATQLVYWTRGANNQMNKE